MMTILSTKVYFTLIVGMCLNRATVQGLCSMVFVKIIFVFSKDKVQRE